MKKWYSTLLESIIAVFLVGYVGSLMINVGLALAFLATMTSNLLFYHIGVSNSLWILTLVTVSIGLGTIVLFIRTENCGVLIEKSRCFAPHLLLNLAYVAWFLGMVWNDYELSYKVLGPLALFGFSSLVLGVMATKCNQLKIK